MLTSSQPAKSILQSAHHSDLSLLETLEPQTPIIHQPSTLFSWYFFIRESSLSLYDYDYSCQVEFTFQIVLLIPSSWNSSSRDITTTTGTSQSLPSWPGGDLIYHCHCSKVATLPDYDTPVAAAHLLLTAIQYLLKITFSFNFLFHSWNIFPP